MPITKSRTEQEGERARGGQGVLYVVATPIGNPADITPRALEVLGGADIVACEDTRRAWLLLASHGIKKPLVSYYEHNEEKRIPELVERLRAGAKIALVTDAGTPGISDPGFRLVRAAHREAVRVAAVPGASAMLAALSVAGIPTDRFTFEGFLPTRDSARRHALEALRAETRTMVFFEAARRLAETLAAMADVLGAGREATVVREATKIHEETIRATLGELAGIFASREALGEVTIVVEGAPAKAVASETGERQAVTIALLLESGLSLKQASAVVAKLTGRSRREVYNEALKAGRGGEREPGDADSEH